MRHSIIMLLAFFFCHTAFAQADSAACLNYQKGYFSYTDSLGNIVLVHRQKKYQYDKNTVTKVRTQFRLSWTGNCSYQITQAITNSKAARKYKNSSTVVVIAKTDGDNGYTYTCECKDGTKINGGYMKKLTKQQYYDLF